MGDELRFKIPPEWRHNLFTVQSHFRDAIIAGGSLRDLELGKPIKDVDIFVAYNPEQHGKPYEIDAIIMEMFPDAVISSTGRYDYFKAEVKQFDREVFAIYKLNTGTAYEFELIITNYAGMRIDSFDFSICQIGYDGYEVYRSTHYMNTLKNKIITHVPNRKVSEDRYRRMSAKFVPEYKIEIQKEFDFNV